MERTDDVTEWKNSHMRPRPGRRRSSTFGRSGSSYVLVFFLISLLCAPALAATARWQTTWPRIEANLIEERDSGEVSTEILFDHRPAPGVMLYRRASSDDKSSDSSDIESPTSARGTPTKRSKSESKGSATETSDATSTDVGSEIITAPTSTDSPLPTAFDGGIGRNFTQESCPDFIRSMVGNTSFTSCLPFSVLLQNSNSFFLASRSVPTIDKVLSASCDVASLSCLSIMSSYALSIRSPSVCSEDYDRENPIVRQAYNSLLAYDVLYRASCLHATPSAQNNHSSDYCFADAVTNTTSPTDAYIYYLPLGIPLPASSNPTCSQCLKDTMGVLQSQAGNKSQPISITYAAGAQLVNMQCGPNFVNASAPSSSGSSGGGSGPGSGAASMVASPGRTAAAVGIGIWTALLLLA